MPDRPTIRLLSAAAIVDPCPVCDAARHALERFDDDAGYGCPRAAAAFAESGDDEAHLRRSLRKGPVRLAAMAAVPKWLRAFTVGRPAWAYAAGDDLQRLLWAAIEERKNGDPGPARAAYFAAMDARWARCVERGHLAPGRWAWAPHVDGEPNGLVPDGAVLVCTCRPAQECHLDALGPWLARGGWRVVGRDGNPVEAG